MPDGHGAKAIIRLRQRIATLFDDDAQHNKVTRYFNAALAFLIIVSVGAVILESVEPIRARHPRLFISIEHIATAIFVVEYGLRVWTAVDLHHDGYAHPLWARLRYVGSFFGLIDLISILPAVLGLFAAGDFRVLRLLRLLRMLKLTRHSTVFALIWNVLREEAHAIGALVFILFLTVTVSGSLMYMIEGEEPQTLFTSIPVCMWWAIETLTTVGYGDMIPATAAGRILGGLVIVVGIVTLALFSGLITVSFIDQLRTMRGRTNVTIATTDIEIVQITGGKTCPHCGGELRAEEA
jgi:voltage-gated potassium channel